MFLIYNYRLKLNSFYSDYYEKHVFFGIAYYDNSFVFICNNGGRMLIKFYNSEKLYFEICFKDRDVVTSFENFELNFNEKLVIPDVYNGMQKIYNKILKKAKELEKESAKEYLFKK
jgi:hypothetical protein